MQEHDIYNEDESPENDGSSVVTYRIEVVVRNAELSPAQRRTMYNQACKMAREGFARMALGFDMQSTVRVRVQRESSQNGNEYIDIYGDA